MHASLAPPRPDGPIVIVLAAGQGSRFLASGGDTHKLQADLDGIPVLQRVLSAVAAADLSSHLVLPAADATAGMGQSIARGVRATANAPGWLILPGDLPLVRPDSIKQVAQALSHHPVVVPRFAGRPGHPVGFGAACLGKLMALSDDTGARYIVQAHRARGAVHDLALDDEGIVTDIDTLEDLMRARRRLQAKGQ